jgi:hypothetical protein
MIGHNNEDDNYLVKTLVLEHVLVRGGVEVVGIDHAALLRGGHGKRSHSCHDVAHSICWLEHLDKTIVLSMKTRVPVHLRKVKLESASALSLTDRQ